MALNNKDLFLVSQATTVGLATTYAEKKVKWSTIKSDLGIRNAKQEKDNIYGIPGMMFPDNSFDYDELSGRLTIPLDARGVKFVDLLDDDNKDKYPDGTEDAGDFYIVDQANLVISSAKWKGISEVDVVADPSQQSIDIAGLGYSPNNGTATVLTMTEAGRAEVDFGPIECLIENGKIIQATHLPTPDDLSALDLETRLFTINGNNSFSFEKAGLLECKNVTVDADGNYVMLLSVVSQGEGHRLFTSAAGSFSGALATPQSGEATSFPIDVDIDEDGKVTAITKVTLNSGHENGDKFDIVMPYGDGPVAVATFELVITGDAEFTVQINDKLIKRSSGDWARLVDQLATQAILTIKNLEENGVDKTPALKIEREVVGDPRFLTLEIETVTSDQPGLMPPDLYDLLLSYPDTVGGGTIYNILIDDEAAIDPLADLSYYSGPEINPVEVVDIVRYVEEGEPNSGEINTEEQKDVKISVGPATVFDTGGGEVRVRGTVYIATQSELITEFGASSIQISGDYDRAINAKIAGEHLMPRNLENLAERTEDFKTAKRLKLTTTAYEIPPAGLATLTSTLTYEDGTEIPDADSTSYTYLWQGIEHLDVTQTVKDLGTGATQLVNGADFKGPTNIICTVNETTDSEFQELTESIYLHFDNPVSPPPVPIVIGNVSIVGQTPVTVGDTHTYTVQITNGTSTDNVITGTVDAEFATNVGNEVTFTKEGMCELTATVESETAADSPKNTSMMVEVVAVAPPPDDLGELEISEPSTVLVGADTAYSYTYTGTGDIINETWSIISVTGDAADHSISDQGVLTCNAEDDVTIQLVLETSLGELTATKVISALAGPSGNENWDNDPDEMFRLHIIIDDVGGGNGSKHNVPPENYFGYKVWNMKTKNRVSSTSPSYTVNVSPGDEFMYIYTGKGTFQVAANGIGRIIYAPPSQRGPILKVGPKSFTAAHDGNYSRIFQHTQLADASLMPLSNATVIDRMFYYTLFERSCKFDFTGAKIKSAKNAFGANSSDLTNGLFVGLGFETMDMSECTTVEGMFEFAHFDANITLNFDLSECTSVNKFVHRSSGPSGQRLSFGPVTGATVGKVTDFRDFASHSRLNQNLSGWCVSSATAAMATNAFTTTSMSSKTEWHPVWETCPGTVF